MTKKILFSLIASLVSFGSTVSADCAPQTTCCEETCCSGTSGFISADLLYLRATQDNLGHCVTDFFSSVDVGGTTVRNYVGRNDDLGYKLKPGFRVGAGLDFEDCGWNVAAFWTHFHTHNSDEHGRLNDIDWRLHYDTIDVLTGQEFCISNSFALRPFGGVRFARIDQRLNLEVFDVPAGSLLFETDKSKFLGAGPLVGLEGSWDIGCDFSVYANGGVSLLFGEYRNHFNGTETDPTLADTFSTKQRQRSSLTVLDAGLGVRWHKTFCGGTHVMVQLGLELHKYYNANRLTSCGDLTLEGFNLSGSYFF